MIKPDFCASNYINTDNNPLTTISLLPVENWYQQDKALLFDNSSRYKL